MRLQTSPAKVTRMGICWEDLTFMIEAQCFNILFMQSLMLSIASTISCFALKFLLARKVDMMKARRQTTF